MSISGINNYNSPTYYDAAKINRTSKKEEVPKNSKTEKNERSVDSDATQKYLEDLQKRHSEINIMSGSHDTSRTSNSNSKTDVMIAPSILKQMASDPEAAMKYEKMLGNLPALDKWADSMIRAVTGSDVKYRQTWIDENGNMGAFCITGPSEETEKANQKKKQEEKIKEQREKQQELMERIKKRNKKPEEKAYTESILKLLSVDYKV